MKSLKVLVINNENDDITLERKILTEAARNKKCNVEIAHISANDELKIKQALPMVDGIISVSTSFDKATLENMKKCKIIATQTIGVDHIDLNAAASKGIYVTNVPDYCVEEVAIHTIALVFACVRKLKIFDKVSRNKKWNVIDIHDFGEIHRLSGQIYGMLAFGKIPKKIAPLIKALGMKVIAYDPYVSVDIFHEHGVEKIEALDELFSKSNIISLHAPLTEETKEMITFAQLKQLPQNAILVNTARGKIIREKDFYKALEEGYITVAGTDVIFDETNYQSALFKLNNIIISPHSAYYSEEAITECRIKATQQIKEVLIEQSIPKYLVNDAVLNQRYLKK